MTRAEERGEGCLQSGPLTSMGGLVGRVLWTVLDWPADYFHALPRPLQMSPTRRRVGVLGSPCRRDPRPRAGGEGQRREGCHLPLEPSRLLPTFLVWGWIWARGPHCPRISQFPSNIFSTRRTFQSPVPCLRGSGAGEVLSTVGGKGDSGQAGRSRHLAPLPPRGLQAAGSLGFGVASPSPSGSVLAPTH